MRCTQPQKRKSIVSTDTSLVIFHHGMEKAVHPNQPTTNAIKIVNAHHLAAKNIQPLCPQTN